MLVHVTRFTSVQRDIADAVRNELHSLVNRLRYGDGAFSPPLRETLKEEWRDDFEKTTSKVLDLGIDDAEIAKTSWDDIEARLVEAASAITIRVINGTVADILDYKTNSEGVSVIAVGGDKLSRGLTLEGLSVSYFLRSSRMYDTLMQMGRWFGYRPGYADLCRLYTTPDLIKWYRHIALASEELKREFEHMAAIGASPKDYGLRVRTHPNGLQITGASKLRTGTEMRVSFSGTIAETVVLFNKYELLKSNADAVASLVLRVDGTARRDDDNPSRATWSHVSADDVIRFLQDYRTHPDAPKVNSDNLAKFIGKKSAEGGLTDWTVVVLRSGSAKMSYNLQPIGNIQLIRRERILVDASRQCLRRIVSPADEIADLTESEHADALARTIEAWERKDPEKRSKEQPTLPSGPFIRDVRPRERGLLLIYPVQFFERETPDKDPDIPVPTEVPNYGIALSFPSAGSGDDDGISYRVTNNYWQQEFELQ